MYHTLKILTIVSLSQYFYFFLHEINICCDPGVIWSYLFVTFRSKNCKNYKFLGREYKIHWLTVTDEIKIILGKMANFFRCFKIMYSDNTLLITNLIYSCIECFFKYLTHLMTLFILLIHWMSLFNLLTHWIVSMYLYTYKSLIILIDCLFVLFVCMFEAVRTFENSRDKSTCYDS